jgi:hypothetical protein
MVLRQLRYPRDGSILMCLERAAKRSYKKLGQRKAFSMESSCLVFLFGFRMGYHISTGFSLLSFSCIVITDKGAKS